MHLTDQQGSGSRDLSSISWRSWASAPSIDECLTLLLVNMAAFAQCHAYEQRSLCDPQAVAPANMMALIFCT